MLRRSGGRTRGLDGATNEGGPLCGREEGGRYAEAQPDQERIPDAWQEGRIHTAGPGAGAAASTAKGAVTGAAKAAGSAAKGAGKAAKGAGKAAATRAGAARSKKK